MDKRKEDFNTFCFVKVVYWLVCFAQGMEEKGPKQSPLPEWKGEGGGGGLEVAHRILIVTELRGW